MNLFIENPNIGQLSSMYMYAWKKGLKTTYYLRSRARPPASPRRTVREQCRRVASAGTHTAAIACSLENPRKLRGLPMSTIATPARSRISTLTLRPMRYPLFYEMYRAAIKNTWTVEEVDFSDRPGRPAAAMTAAERHLIQRLVAFFATGDSIVANNLVLNLYKHINAPEARMYLSRQLYEEALHVQFYLTLLDNYVPDPERARRGLRGGREHPVDPAQGGVLPALDRLDR